MHLTQYQLASLRLDFMFLLEAQHINIDVNVNIHF